MTKKYISDPDAGEAVLMAQFVAYMAQVQASEKLATQAQTQKQESEEERRKLIEDLVAFHQSRGTGMVGRTRAANRLLALRWVTSAEVPGLIKAMEKPTLDLEIPGGGKRAAGLVVGAAAGSSGAKKGKKEAPPGPRGAEAADQIKQEAEFQQAYAKAVAEGRTQPLSANALSNMREAVLGAGMGIKNGSAMVPPLAMREAGAAPDWVRREANNVAELGTPGVHPPGALAAQFRPPSRASRNPMFSNGPAVFKPKFLERTKESLPADGLSALPIKLQLKQRMGKDGKIPGPPKRKKLTKKEAAAEAAREKVAKRAGEGGKDEGFESLFARVVDGPSETFPHMGAIMAAAPELGSMLSDVRAYIGDLPGQLLDHCGAHGAVVDGVNVLFAKHPSLELASHEAVHVAQQKAGMDVNGRRAELETDADAGAAGVVGGGAGWKAYAETMGGRGWMGASPSLATSSVASGVVASQTQFKKSGKGAARLEGSGKKLRKMFGGYDGLVSAAYKALDTDLFRPTGTGLAADLATSRLSSLWDPENKHVTFSSDRNGKPVLTSTEVGKGKFPWDADVNFLGVHFKAYYKAEDDVGPTDSTEKDASSPGGSGGASLISSLSEAMTTEGLLVLNFLAARNLIDTAHINDKDFLAELFTPANTATSVLDAIALVGRGVVRVLDVLTGPFQNGYAFARGLKKALQKKNAVRAVNKVLTELDTFTCKISLPIALPAGAVVGVVASGWKFIRDLPQTIGDMDKILKELTKLVGKFLDGGNSKLFEMLGEGVGNVFAMKLASLSTKEGFSLVYALGELLGEVLLAVVLGAAGVKLAGRLATIATESKLGNSLKDAGDQLRKYLDKNKSDNATPTVKRTDDNKAAPPVRHKDDSDDDIGPEAAPETETKTKDKEDKEDKDKSKKPAGLINNDLLTGDDISAGTWVAADGRSKPSTAAIGSLNGQPLGTFRSKGVHAEKNFVEAFKANVDGLVGKKALKKDEPNVIDLDITRSPCGPHHSECSMELVKFLDDLKKDGYDVMLNVRILSIYQGVSPTKGGKARQYSSEVGLERLLSDPRVSVKAWDIVDDVKKGKNGLHDESVKETVANRRTIIEQHTKNVEGSIKSAKTKRKGLAANFDRVRRLFAGKGYRLGEPRTTRLLEKEGYTINGKRTSKNKALWPRLVIENKVILDAMPTSQSKLDDNDEEYMNA